MGVYHRDALCTLCGKVHCYSRATSRQWRLTLWSQQIWEDRWILSKLALAEYSATQRISAAIFNAVKGRYIGATPSLHLLCSAGEF